MNLFEELDTLDPSSKIEPPRIETPTAHKITVLILLKQYVIVGVPSLYPLKIPFLPKCLYLFQE